MHGPEDDGPALAPPAHHPRAQPRHPGAAASAAARGHVRQGRGDTSGRAPGTEREAAVHPTRREARRVRPRGAVRADGLPRGRPDGHPPLHHPYPHRRGLPRPASVRPAHDRTGVADLPCRSGRGGPGPARRVQQGAGRGTAPAAQGVEGGTGRAVARRRPARTLRRRALPAAARAGHTARAVGTRRSGHAHDSPEVVRGRRGRRGGGQRAGHRRAALPRRLRTRLRAGHADLVPTHPARPGLRAAARSTPHLPGRVRRRTLRPPRRPQAGPRHPGPAALPPRVRQPAALARRPHPRRPPRLPQAHLERQPGPPHLPRRRVPRRHLAVGGRHGGRRARDADGAVLRRAHPRAARRGGRGGRADARLALLGHLPSYVVRFADLSVPSTAG